jgi:hypothetical protein
VFSTFTGLDMSTPVDGPERGWESADSEFLSRFARTGETHGVAERAFAEREDLASIMMVGKRSERMTRSDYCDDDRQA